MTDKKPEKCDLYFAFGSNLNMAQMVRRCPNAEAQGKFFAPRGKLVFRGVADVVNASKSDVPGGLYKLGEGDEAKLDRYEGYDPEFPTAGAYRKSYLWFKLRSGKTVPCLFYRMNRKGILPPTKEYLGRIAQGYKDFDLPIERLQEAVEHAWAKRNETAEIRDWRRTRNYRPARLSPPPKGGDEWFDNEPTIPAGYKITEGSAPGIWRLIDPAGHLRAASTDPYELVKRAETLANGAKMSMMKKAGVVYGD